MVAGRLQNIFNLEVNSNSGKYQIASSIEALNINNPDEFILLHDKNVRINENLSMISRVIEVEGNEGTKTLSGAEQVLTNLASLGLKKNQTLIACGGGAVQDLATFVSSIYMRGVNWVYVPTTLMAMMDSCIGGKSSINVGPIKNLVGNFYPPTAILIDPNYIKTLSKAAIACGLLEAVKICYAKDPELAFEFSEKAKLWLNRLDDQSLLALTETSLLAKKWFIEIDEFDLKERKLLNFGHSFGHALESATNMSIPHGIAIGIGMIVAGKVSNQNSRWLEDFIYELLAWAGFSSKDILFDDIVFKNSLLADKKNSKDLQRLILLNENRKLYLAEKPLDPVEINLQTSIMQEILKGLE